MNATSIEKLECEAKSRLDGLLHGVDIGVDGSLTEDEAGACAARRFVSEVFAGSFANEPSLTVFPNVARSDELIVTGPLSLRRDCSDDTWPITGKLWIGMLMAPGRNLSGLSKCTQLTDWITWRPQRQEEALGQLAEALLAVLKLNGVAVKLCVDRHCARWPGECDQDEDAAKIVMRGAFLAQPQRRRQFLTACFI